MTNLQWLLFSRAKLQSRKLLDMPCNTDRQTRPWFLGGETDLLQSNIHNSGLLTCQQGGKGNPIFSSFSFPTPHAPPFPASLHICTQYAVCISDTCRRLRAHACFISFHALSVRRRYRYDAPLLIAPDALPWSRGCMYQFRGIRISTTCSI